MAALPAVGFEMLRMFFIQQNYFQSKLLKIKPPVKKKNDSWSGGYYGSSSY